MTRPRIMAILMLLAAAGCAPPGEIFPPLAKPLAWPPAPETPRITYVGQLAVSSDLKPSKSAFQGIGEAFFGAAEPQPMQMPQAVCTDGKSRVFAVDRGAMAVHVFNLANRKYELWKPAEPAAFAQPVGIAYDPAGRLFVSDSRIAAIFTFDDAGKFLGMLGADVLKRPTGLAFDPATRRIFVADTAAHQIVVLDEHGAQMTRIGTRGSGHGEFNFPTNVALDSKGRLYVSDTLNFRVQVFGRDFKFIRQIGSQGDMPGYFAQPKGLALDTQDHLYVVDAQFESVQLFDEEGRLLMDFGQEGAGAGEFSLPAGIFIDRQNRVWIADSYNGRIQVFDFHPELKP